MTGDDFQAYVDARPRWRRRLDYFRRDRMPWHARAWYHVHRFLLWAVVGDNGYQPRFRELPRPLHAFMCRRWTPHWDAYLARQRGSIR